MNKLKSVFGVNHALMYNDAITGEIEIDFNNKEHKEFYLLGLRIQDIHSEGVSKKEMNRARYLMKKLGYRGSMLSNGNYAFAVRFMNEIPWTNTTPGRWASDEEMEQLKELFS